MMKIDELPTEVLMKIFGYLRSYGDVSLVSRRFYDVVCSVPDSMSFSSIFDEENGTHQSVMESVQNTRRKISKLRIDFWNNNYGSLVRESATSDAVAIVKKFSATIKHFELRDVRMEMSDFLDMLTWLPNAQHLVLTGAFVKERSPTDRQLGNECLNFDRLETLELHQCSPEFLVVFNRLPAGVLKKLTIFNYGTLNLGLFRQQSNIKELTLTIAGDSTLPNQIFDYLKLESLELHHREYNSSLATILSKQTKLIHLRLCEGRADVQILNVITSQLSELETLAVKVNGVPFRRIEKLEKLKELTLQTSSLKIIEMIAGLDNSRITTLNMEEIDTTDVPVNVVAALANSVRNLKVLRFGYHCKCQTIAAVMEHFNFLEVLEMRLDHHMDATGFSQAMEVGRCFNPKLTELKIENFPCHESVLTKMAAVYPNLKKLDIRSSLGIRITPPLFKVILTEFKNMESLRLEFHGWRFSTEYVECITEHKNQLKSITLGRFDYKFTVEHKEKLGAVFDVLKYQDRTLHFSN